VIMSRLAEGKIVGITGAASGIGRSTALLAAREGAAGLVVTDMNPDGLADLVEDTENEGVKTASLVGSIDQPEIPDGFVQLAVKSFGRLDAAVNNAGISGQLEAIDGLSDSAWDRVNSVNSRSVFRCIRAELRQMYSQGSGAIVSVGSAGVYGVHPRLSAYTASKCAVIGLSKVAAVGEAPKVCVSELSARDAPIHRLHRSYGGQGGSARDGPLGRVAESDEIAQALLWMCSDRSSFVTGEVMVVDGGRTIA
jgi:NAD(P)-dependent dehydrogenase (short-subunit alcohol dehydrogenase family)